jgi:hypothetical protein
VRLRDAVVESADLFNVDGGLFWCNGAGELVQVTRNVLLEIVSQHVVEKRLVQRGAK